MCNNLTNESRLITVVVCYVLNIIPNKISWVAFSENYSSWMNLKKLKARKESWLISAESRSILQPNPTSPCLGNNCCISSHFISRSTFREFPYRDVFDISILKKNKTYEHLHFTWIVRYILHSHIFYQYIHIKTKNLMFIF